jgi:predicted MPP superfamily phosphohydrolase
MIELAIAIVSLGIALILWGVLVERNRFTVVRDELAVLKPGSKPIRVLHISDFHLAPWQKRKQAWIANLVELQPDLVVNTGDNLGHRDAIRPTLKSLESLLKVPGVFVNGSNDYHSPEIRNPLAYLNKPSTPSHKELIDSKKLTDPFEAAGWKNLNNSQASLTILGTRIGFLGLDDPHDELAEFASLPGQKQKLGAPDLLLGVAHAPYLRVLEEFSAQGAELVFAGHTHGGQVCLPKIGALVTNCDLPAKMAKGLSSHEFEKRTVFLNVCAGLGTSIFAPIRLFCKPEVRLLTLVAKS